MSIFGSIMSSIFGKSAAAQDQTIPAKDANSSAAATSKSPGPAASTEAIDAAGQVSQVDVALILDSLTKASKEKDIDWRKSIVDLMKLLNLDSGLPARQALAKELGYPGDVKKSAEMNVWLHKQVMIKLAENGGKVPDELKL